MHFLRPSSLRLALFTFVLLALSVPQLASAQPAPTQYTTITVPGSIDTYAYSINDHGQVAGWWYDDGGEHGFVYDHGTYTSVDVPGASSTAAFGINNRDQIVGWAGYYDSGFVYQGFVYDHGVYTALPDLPGSRSIAHWGINDRGDIAVQSDQSFVLSR